MSLVADYGSDSDSDAGLPVVTKPAPLARATVTLPPSITFRPPDVQSAKKPAASLKPPKKKKTLHLPPEMQKLLESGRALNSDDESDTESKAMAQKARKPLRKRDEVAGDALSFLPPPKVELQVLPASQPPPRVQPKQVAEPDHVPHEAPVSASQAYHDPNFVSNYSFDDEHAAEDYGRGKRARNNERELERLLQQGKFDAVAGKITEVKAAAPDSWQPPIDSRGYAHDKEAQVLASMAGTETEGGYVISSYRPTRLQRQRHQLNQLTFDAKLREFDLMDSRSQMVKSKKETAAKYGW
ncbi:Aste57867_24457 [Aphanomyces stellatus]|uniref:Aste57867_24457 protein n=1 Tax=Aphanomyces stellatus TaxID=120398 RepID=A0A485LR70_9STRA|nr:hypothetical protein As57867_024381 [Aphanomyces stellatus]VFU01097.1 Aste57867_24457 [Aphanomyces stellatus]